MSKIIFSLVFLLLGCGCYLSSSYSHLRNREAFQEQFSINNQAAAFPADKILNLSDIQKIVLQNNLDYRSMIYAVQAAKRRYYQFFNGYLPRIDINSGVAQELEKSYDVTHPPADIYPERNGLNVGVSMQASYLIFDGLEREIAILLARNEYRMNLKSAENLQRILLRASAYTYYDAILAQAEMEIAQADLDFQLSSLAQAEERYKNGFVSQAAVLNFKILANQARSNLLNALYRYECAAFALINLMGYDDGELKNLKLQFISENKLKNSELKILSLATYLDLAVVNRVDLQQSLLILQNAELRKKETYAAFMPQIYLKADLGFTHEYSKLKHHDFNKYKYDEWGFSYGIYGKWNIFRGFADYNKLREAESYERYYLLQLGRKYLDIVTEVQIAYANYRNACVQVELYRQSCQWVKEQRDLVQAEYWGGQDTITRLNGAQSAVVESESKLAIALINSYKTLAQLEAAINLPL